MESTCIIVTHRVFVVEKSYEAQHLKDVWKRKEILTKNRHEMIKNSPTINVKPSASSEAISDSVDIRRHAGHWSGEAAMLPLQPPRQRWVRGTRYRQKEEHRGNHHQIQGFGGRAESVGSAESQGEACGFEPWGAVCTFPVDLGPRTKWLPQCEPCEWLRVYAVFTLFPSPDKNQTELGGVPGCSRTVLHTVVGNSLSLCRFMKV